MGKKVLVVDNHPVMLKWMSGLIQKEGHQVLTAKDGLSALDVLKTHVPDIIFTDLIMPNINGENLCKMIRRDPRLSGPLTKPVSAFANDHHNTDSVSPRPTPTRSRNHPERA